VSGQLLTARQVANELGVHVKTILAWVQRGELPAFRLPGGAIRFRATDLEAWLEERATPGRGAPTTTTGAARLSLSSVVPTTTTDEEA